MPGNIPFALSYLPHQREEFPFSKAFNRWTCRRRFFGLYAAPRDECHGNQEKIVGVSGERYAKTWKEVEEKIHRWSNF
jgi:hypothetical protein